MFTCSAKKRYSQLESVRWSFLDRARQTAKLTIPSLIPEDTHSTSQRFFTPYQSMGARGTNNLASKLLLTLLPPGVPFFRQDLTPDLEDEAEADPEVKEALRAGFAKMEKRTIDEVEARQTRTALFETMKHLIVGGNAMLHVPDEGAVRMYPLSTYVCSRDYSGNLLEAIVKQTVSPASLPANVVELVEKAQAAEPAPSGDENVRINKHNSSESVNQSVEKSVDLYTCMCLKEGKWMYWQEVSDGIEVPDSRGTYPKEAPPMLALRFVRIDGEDYGRGYAEEYFGDLATIEGLSEAIVMGSIAAAKVLFLVDPNGSTRAKSIAEAPSGAVRAGRPDDVGVVQMNKHADFRVAQETIQSVEARLAHAFLLNSAVQRQAERVTAEEIRYMSQELEDALGGLYALMSQELQLPLVNRVQHMLRQAGKLPQLPKGDTNIKIVTGLDALGRHHELNRLDDFVAGAAQVVGPEAVQRRIDEGVYLQRRAAALGIDDKGLVRTNQQVQQADQQAQAQAMANTVVEKGAGPVAQGAVDAMSEPQA